MNKLLDQSVDHGISQIINSPNKWALELWKKANANHWNPMEVDMSTDIKQWKINILSDDEKLLVKRILGLFSAGESLVSNSIFSVERIYITDGCCRQYLGKKDYEEQLHNMTVAVCCEAYGLDPTEVSEAYHNIKSVKNKVKFLKKHLDSFDKDFDIKSIDGKKQFLKNIVLVYLLMEGTWFFTAFAAIMGLCRQNKLPGLYDQIIYTSRDETLHVEFGIRLINQLKEEYPSIWSKDIQQQILEMVKEGLELEINFAKESVPNGILGITSDMLVDYAKYLCNMRLDSIKLPKLFNEVKNPFSWLVEAQDLPGMSAFFERREKSYQHAGALQDDL